MYSEKEAWLKEKDHGLEKEEHDLEGVQHGPKEENGFQIKTFSSPSPMEEELDGGKEHDLEKETMVSGKEF